MGLPPKAAASRGVKTKTSRVPTHRHDLGGHAGPHERSSVLRGASATASSMRRARGSFWSARGHLRSVPQKRGVSISSLCNSTHRAQAPLERFKIFLINCFFRLCRQQ